MLPFCSEPACLCGHVCLCAPHPPTPPPWQCFAVRSLGWVEMSEEEMAPGRSSVAVNNCIRQLSYHKHNLHDTAGIWGEVREADRKWPWGTSFLGMSIELVVLIFTQLALVSPACGAFKKISLWYLRNLMRVIWWFHQEQVSACDLPKCNKSHM